MKAEKWERIGFDPTDMKFQNKEVSEFYAACMQELIKLVGIFRAKETKEYFFNFISAIILEYNKENPNYKIKIAFRMKALKSIFDKIVDHLSRDNDKKAVYGQNPQRPYKPTLLKEITDVFAMTIILESREKVYFSKDPEIQRLVDKEKRSDEVHSIMQQFKSQITEIEYMDSSKKGYQYNCSRQLYYIMSILLVRKTMSLINPNATELLKEYENLLKGIKKVVPKKFYDKVTSEINETEVLSFYDSAYDMRVFLEMLNRKVSNDDKLTSEDKEFLSGRFTESDVQTLDFVKVYQEFVAKITDELDLVLLTKQIEALFSSSKLLKAFAVKIREKSLVQKRMPNGFVANFITVETPFGPIEIQLASEHEYEEGNRGYAAHNKMDRKKFRLLSIPKKDDEKGIRFFRKWARFISPSKFLATSSGMIADRVSIEIGGDRENLELTISQEQKGSADYQKIADYCKELNEREEELFPEEEAQGKVKCYMRRTITKYAQEKSWIPFLKRKRAQIQTEVDKIEQYEYDK